MTIQLSDLWDFNNPELSEQRFHAALASASGEDGLILKTQIARTYGMRGEFSKALQILAEIEPELEKASAEVRTYYYLELGRCFGSAAHPPETQTPQNKEKARAAFQQAFDLAQAAQQDSLAIDALHMMTFVDSAGEEQIAWNRKAIAIMESSTQPDGWKWEGSLHNNMGYALHTLGRYEEALQEFKKALEARERQGNPGVIRIAKWMIGWTMRSLGRLDEALEIQLQLERECDEAGEPDPYVYEELEAIYRALGDKEKAEVYARKRAEIKQGELGLETES